MNEQQGFVNSEKSMSDLKKFIKKIGEINVICSEVGRKAAGNLENRYEIQRWCFEAMASQ